MEREEDMSAKARIYLATSWRNEHQPRILALLREAGHEVYDFHNPQVVRWMPPPHRHCLGGAVSSGFSWDEVDPDWRAWTPEGYVNGLQHPRAQEGFRRDFDAMRWCDICVVLMPCGPSAALEAGWCRGNGRGLIVHVAGMREPDLMYLVADQFTLTDKALLDAIDNMMDAIDTMMTEGL